MTTSDKERYTLIKVQYDVLYKQYFLCYELFSNDPFTQDVICSTIRRAMDDMLDLLEKGGHTNGQKENNPR